MPIQGTGLADEVREHGEGHGIAGEGARGGDNQNAEGTGTDGVCVGMGWGGGVGAYKVVAGLQNDPFTCKNFPVVLNRNFLQ